jgi:hypothetical protein
MTKMRVWKLNPDTLMDRIKAHYLEEYDLTAADDKIRQRWEAAHAALLDKESDAGAVRILMTRFNISYKQAYIDIGNSKQLFGDIRKSSKDSMRYMVSQWAIDLLKKAETEKDYYAAAKALEKLIKANNLDKEDQDLPDPSKIQPPVQLLTINISFINSPWFSKIDPKAQEILRELHDRFVAMVQNSPAREYLDMITSPQPLLPDGD